MRYAYVLALAVCLGSVGADASLISNLGHGNPHGGGGGGSGTAYAVDPNGTGVRADFSNGQTFITWPDTLATGVTDYTKRYRVVMSSSPITALNYGSATVIGNYDLPNSGQLFGGSPDVAGGTAFTQANRQDSTKPMSLVPDANLGGTRTLSYATGMQVHTALTSANQYFGVIVTDTSDGSDSYLGSAGPIAENVGTPQPVLYAASGSRADNSYGTLTSTAGGCLVASCPVVLSLHQSSSSGGNPAWSNYGDYYEWWLTTAEGWQDGRATTLDVHQDNASHYPSLTHSLEITNRDTVWNPLGTGALETYHYGLGLTPNPLVGVPNKVYPITANGISRMLSWSIGHYNADPNQVHQVGVSMGAWGSTLTSLHSTNPHFASIMVGAPIWRQDRRSCVNWAGATWSTLMPFRATLDSGGNNCFLGTTASAVQLASGVTWGGTGGYADGPSFVASNVGTDLPFFVWDIAKDDPYPFSFLEQTEAATAFETAHRGYAFCWTMGTHSDGTTIALVRALIDRDWTSADTSIAYSKAKFALNLPYPAFANSSINDNPGTGVRQASGLYDGDHAGCMNAGFTWSAITETATTANLTVGNGYMNRAPTAEPSTTLTGTIASSGSGSVAVTDGTVFASASTNPYFQIGNEVVNVTGISGNTVTFTTRGLLGTTAAAHSAGETITQFLQKPTGPNIGAQTSMTVDIALRRLQTYHPTAPSCTATPFGGSATPLTTTLVSGIPVMTSVPINAGGSTSIACSG